MIKFQLLDKLLSLPSRERPFWIKLLFMIALEKSFRTCVSKQEILDSLSALYIEGSPVIIWQTINGVRNMKKALISSIDLIRSSIVLKAGADSGGAGFDQLNSNLTLYFLGESKNIVFKQIRSLKILDKDRVQVEIPDVVKLQEKRIDQRLVFDNAFSKVTGWLYPGGRTDKSTSPTVIELIDISLTGVGFLLPKKSARYFYEKDKIKIDKLGPHQFNRPIHGVIVYISEVKQHSTHIKVGVRFSERLDEEVLNKLRSS